MEGLLEHHPVTTAFTQEVDLVHPFFPADRLRNICVPLLLDRLYAGDVFIIRCHSETERDDMTRYNCITAPTGSTAGPFGHRVSDKVKDLSFWMGEPFFPGNHVVSADGIYLGIQRWMNEFHGLSP